MKTALDLSGRIARALSTLLVAGIFPVRSGSAGPHRWKNRAGRGRGPLMPSGSCIAPGERLEARHALAGFDITGTLAPSSVGDEADSTAPVFTTSNQVPAGGTILAAPVEPAEIGQVRSFLEAVPGVARISVPASKGGVDYRLDVLDVPRGTSLYKALKIPASGLFPQDDVLNRFAVSTNWYSSLDVASAYADSDWGQSQGYQVVEFAAPKGLRLIDLGDNDTLGYVWASLESDVAWTESQLAILEGADPPTTNPEAVAIVRQKLVELRRDMEIVQLTTGYNASYATQLDLLQTYGDAITNDFTYDPGVEIVRRGISPTDTFVVETATPSVWRPATLVTGTTPDPVDLVTWGGTADDLNRISFTTDIDKELTSILGTYLNVDGYFAAELPSLFHRDGRLIEEVGLFVPRDSTTIVTRQPALVLGGQDEPWVQVVAATGTPHTNFLAYEAAFRGGVRVASGDVTGDGTAEIIVAPGPNRPGEIRVFTQQGVELPSYRTLAFGPRYRGGVDVTVGDIDGDGVNEIIASRTSGLTRVNVFGVDPLAADPVADVPIRRFVGLPAFYRNGGGVTAGDYGTFVGGVQVSADPDGIDEIAVGSNAGIRAQVRLFDAFSTPRLVQRFFAFGARFRRGVSLSTAQWDGVGAEDIVVGAGVGGGSVVEIYGGNSFSQLARLTAFSSFGQPNAAVNTAALDLDGDGIVDNLYSVQGRRGTGGSRGVRRYDRITTDTTTLPGSTVLQPPLRIAPITLRVLGG
jgi:hypothetical protein